MKILGPQGTAGEIYVCTYICMKAHMNINVGYKKGLPFDGIGC